MKALELVQDRRGHRRLAEAWRSVQQEPRPVDTGAVECLVQQLLLQCLGAALYSDTRLRSGWEIHLPERLFEGGARRTRGQKACEGGGRALDRRSEQRRKVVRQRRSGPRARPCRGRHDLVEREHKVAGLDGDGRRLQHEPLLRVVDLRVPALHRVERGLGAERTEIGAAKALGRICEHVAEVRVERRVPAAGMNVQDAPPRLAGREREEKLAVKTAGAAQCRVHGVGPVRRANHHHLPASVHAVHERQEGAHDARVNLVLLARAHRRKPVDLVEEDNARLRLFRLVEQEAQLPLRLTDPLGEAVGALAHEEADRLLGRRAARGERAGHKRLTRTRRSVEQDATRRRHTKSLEHLGVQKRQAHHLLELLHVLVQTAHLGEVRVHAHPERIHVRQRVARGLDAPKAVRRRAQFGHRAAPKQHARRGPRRRGAGAERAASLLVRAVRRIERERRERAAGR